MLRDVTKVQILVALMSIFISWDWYDINQMTESIPYFIAILPGVNIGLAIHSLINDIHVQLRKNHD